ncbi:hypothetical protein B296_00015410 [Ensete ventricosum]|uniref:beta-ketoacyl-[acyl-carrier-protein] synthase I n=1 Tax=Ensete ventricosum TaxID=4639 RepID=A0A426XWK1_ENSVE|nr:hypothetical protein B296_00015410 [Ensete ventricosum]
MVDQYTGKTILRHRNNAYHLVRLLPTIPDLLGGKITNTLLYQSAIRTRWIHPNINLDNPEKSVDVNLLVGSKKERLDVKVAVSNSFGFGGHNSSILLAPYKQ